MQHSTSARLRIALLAVILHTTSFAGFAQTSSQRTSRATKPRADVPATVINPELTPAASTTITAADSSVSPGPELTPQLKKRKRVVIVPAPPPGQIPVYVPEKH